MARKMRIKISSTMYVIGVSGSLLVFLFGLRIGLRSADKVFGILVMVIGLLACTIIVDTYKIRKIDRRTKTITKSTKKKVVQQRTQSQSQSKSSAPSVYSHLNAKTKAERVNMIKQVFSNANHVLNKEFTKKEIMDAYEYMTGNKYPGKAPKTKNEAIEIIRVEIGKEIRKLRGR